MRGRRWVVAGVAVVVVVAVVVGGVLASGADDLEPRLWLPLVMGGARQRPTPTPPRPTPTTVWGVGR